jgi:hypothetical protein
MNQEDIIRMAREAGLKVTSDNEILPSYLGSVSDGYFKLAKLAVAAEREACAKMCDYVYNNIVTDEHIKDMAFKIRARGETK